MVSPSPKRISTLRWCAYEQASGRIRPGLGSRLGPVWFRLRSTEGQPHDPVPLRSADHSLDPRPPLTGPRHLAGAASPSRHLARTIVPRSVAAPCHSFAASVGPLPDRRTALKAGAGDCDRTAALNSPQSTVRVQVRALVLWGLVAGWVMILGLTLLIEVLILLFPGRVRPPPVALRVGLYVVVYAILACGLWIAQHAFRVRDMSVSEEGIRLSGRGGLIRWDQVESCHQASGAWELTLTLRDGRQLILDKLSVRNYEEVRSALASKISITETSVSS